MKQSIFFKIPQIVFLITLIFFLQSCDRDKCENVFCTGPESYCVDGFCVCPQGYEGPNCDMLSQDKYVGNYIVSESCNPGTPSGWNSSYISPGNGIDKIIVNNVINSGLSAEAVVNGNFITFPSQNLGSIKFAGQGTFIENANRMEFTYEYYRNGTANRCTAYFTKN